MFRSSVARELRGERGALFAGALMGLLVASCQGPEEFYRNDETGLGQGGSTDTGSGGSILTGTGGSAVATGGSAVATGGSSTGGSNTGGGNGLGGMPGSGGRGGDRGAGGSGSPGGATGAAGSGGRGGLTGAAGSGRGGIGGTTGIAGRGGNTGAAGGGGRGGRGGSTGAGGSPGTAGTSGGSCPLGGKLTCTSAGSLKLTPDGQVVTFSPGEWQSTSATWCDAHGLGGGISAFMGTSSTATAAVDTTAQNLKLDLTVGAGQYAGGRVNFDACVDASGFTSVQFSASVTSGSLTNCTWQVQLQTQDQRPSTATNPTGGTCNATTTTCERYPAYTLGAASAVATTFTAPFASFSNPANSAIATPSQIAGLQWQVNSGNSGSGTCTVELRIDNVKFQ